MNPFVIVRGAADFIAFATDVFGARETTAVRTPDRDGTLIHAEVVLGDATIMLADAKPGWPFTPAFLQVYLDDAAAALERATRAGATLITPLSSFYGGYDLARLRDPWHNLWWLYAPAAATTPADRDPGQRGSSTDWHDQAPSAIYTTLMDAMGQLSPPELV